MIGSKFWRCWQFKKKSRSMTLL